MTAYALITGTIFRPAQSKMSKAGKPYTTCTIKAATDGNESDFWSVLCFSESAQLELLRLEIADAVSIRGKLKIETYVANDGTTKISRSIFADGAVGLRPVPRKAKAAKPGSPATQGQAEQSGESSTPFYDDPIPFLMEWR